MPICVASRLVERGAATTLVDAATLGLSDRVEEHFTGVTPPTPDEVTRAFWGACHGGRQRCAEYLLDRGADLNRIPPWEDVTPFDAAARERADELVRWLRDRGARFPDASAWPEPRSIRRSTNRSSNFVPTVRPSSYHEGLRRPP